MYITVLTTQNTMFEFENATLVEAGDTFQVREDNGYTVFTKMNTQYVDVEHREEVEK